MARAIGGDAMAGMWEWGGADGVAEGISATAAAPRRHAPWHELFVAMVVMHVVASPWARATPLAKDKGCLATRLLPILYRQTRLYV